MKISSLSWLNLKHIDKDVSSNNWIGSLIQAAIIILCFYLLHTFIFGTFRLREAAFDSPSILWEILTHPRIYYKAILIGFIAAVLFLVTFRKLTWKSVDSGGVLRVLILISVVVVTWAFALYDYNFYYDHFHWIERIFLVILAVGVFFSPNFVPPFLILTIIITSQFHYPVASYAMIDKRVLYDILLLFSFYLYSRLIFKKNVPMFILLAITIVASSYFHSGVVKAQLDWLAHTDLDNLFISSYINGWLGFLDEQSALAIAKVIQSVNFPLALMTLGIELAAILILTRKSLTYGILMLSMLLHIGIFAASGIFFWKWVVLDGALMIVLAMLSIRELKELYSVPFVVASVLIIFFSPSFFKPSILGWYDTRINNMFELEAITESKEIYPLNREHTSPYSVIFNQNKFKYLYDGMLLVGTYGATLNKEILKASYDIATVEDLNHYEQTIGHNQYREGLRAGFEKFVARFFANVNDREKLLFYKFPLSPPHHIWAFAKEPYLNLPDVRIDRVQVRLVKTLYNGSSIKTLSSEVFMEIDIPD